MQMKSMNHIRELCNYLSKWMLLNGLLKLCYCCLKGKRMNAKPHKHEQSHVVLHISEVLL